MLAVDVPGYGRLTPTDTVYVTRDGEQAVGLLVADDESGQPCLVILGLALDEEGGVQTTLLRVVQPGGPDAAPEADAARHATILVVEDDPGLRALACATLEQELYSVLEAENGREALALAERRAAPIDLLLTDVEMPLLSGPELVARLCPLHPEMGVLYMSGCTTSQLCSLAVPQGRAFLQKPFNPGELTRRVGSILCGDI
jgi:two-component system, cell cycle sensor histidine kinase and response regulator CckA